MLIPIFWQALGVAFENYAGRYSYNFCDLQALYAADPDWTGWLFCTYNRGSPSADSIV